MVWKATLKKQSFKQPLPKVSSEPFFKIGFLKNSANVQYWAFPSPNWQKHRWCSIKPCSTHSKTTELESNTVSDLKADNFIKKRLQLRYFPVSIAKCYRTHPFTFFVSLMR